MTGTFHPVLSVCHPLSVLSQVHACSCRNHHCQRGCSGRRLPDILHICETTFCGQVLSCCLYSSFLHSLRHGDVTSFFQRLSPCIYSMAQADNHTSPAPAPSSTAALLPESAVDTASNSHIREIAVSRKRPASPATLSPGLRKIASAGLDRERRSASPKQSKRPRMSPQPLTAAAAIADNAEARRTEIRKDNQVSEQSSPNPAKQALGALMGMSGTTQTSNTSAAPMSDALRTIAQNIQISTSDVPGDSQTQTSPVSLSSFGTIGSSTAATALPVSSTVDSPGSLLEEAVQGAVREMRESTAEASPEDGNKAFSYPGPHPPLPPHMTEPRRGMSLPQSASRQAGSRSPSAKKHRCPYCSTEFTRHHNLKSHLLTHSQEKPYVCQTCQSRFRRLHDLKRHTKLHTGERPHTCPKCGRRFARGDALARHNKGPGGCAGRRASVGSYGGDDDYQEGNDDSNMEGVVYTEPGQMEEDDDGTARPPMPSIKKHQAPEEPASQQTSGSSYHSRTPSTYPPIQGRPPGGISGGLFPPPAHGATSATTSPISQSGSMSFPPVQASNSLSHTSAQPGAPGFTAGGITESPKPLSPGAGQTGHTDSALYRNRSPSMNAQYQSQSYGRGSGRRTPPPNVGGLPPPQSLGPQLPPPHGLNPPDSRYTLHSQGPAHPPTGPTGPPSHMSGGGLSSQSNSLSSHGHSHPGSGEGAGSLYPQIRGEERLWAYVKSLEDRINGLQDEVSGLKSQLAIANQHKSR